MKLAKNILIIIGGIILALVLIAFFLPSSYHVERTTEINQSVDKVYEQVIDFRKYQLWNPWSETDPQAKNEITGEAGTQGSQWRWDGKIVGKGSLTLVEYSTNDFIRNRLVFEYPNQMESSDLWLFEEKDGKTIVRWVNSGELNFPIGRLFGLFLDNMLGDDFERGLSNLKKRCENLPEAIP